MLVLNSQLLTCAGLAEPQQHFTQCPSCCLTGACLLPACLPNHLFAACLLARSTTPTLPPSLAPSPPRPAPPPLVPPQPCGQTLAWRGAARWCWDAAHAPSHQGEYCNFCLLLRHLCCELPGWPVGNTCEEGRTMEARQFRSTPPTFSLPQTVHVRWACPARMWVADIVLLQSSWVVLLAGQFTCF